MCVCLCVFCLEGEPPWNCLFRDSSLIEKEPLGPELHREAGTRGWGTEANLLGRDTSLMNVPFFDIFLMENGKRQHSGRHFAGCTGRDRSLPGFYHFRFPMQALAQLQVDTLRAHCPVSILM